MKQEELIGDYKLVLGLEIHLHIKTKTKMFCRCNSDIYKAEPNTHTCPVCLGLPGALPVPNPSAVKSTHILGMALHCKLNSDSRFDRKHYFYPDLPKGYQISQYKQPLCTGGYMDLDSGFRVNLERIHLEEDTAKSFHESEQTYLDFNMSGMPLIEIVTKPVFKNISDAVEFCKKIQMIVRDLDLGEVDMEKGQMRLEPNISIRTSKDEKDDILPPYKVEIKNINSFRFMEKAVLAEISRQRSLLENSQTPIQENRGFIEAKNETVSQRKKEEAHDYRYFPEPDIPPMFFDDKYFDDIKKQYEDLIKNSPLEQKRNIIEKLNLDDAIKNKLLIDSNIEYGHVQKILELEKLDCNIKTIANKFINRADIREMEIDQIKSLLDSEKDKLSDENILENSVDKVIKENNDAVMSYKNGKENTLQFLIGMVMRETKGKADAEIVKNILISKIIK